MSDNDLRYLMTPLAGLVLPGGQALITGGIVAAGIVSLSYLADIPHPWAAGGIAFALAGGLAWANGVSWWRSSIAPIAAAPQQTMVYANEARLSLSIDWDEGRAGLFADLNITDDQFIEWACGAAAGRSLGENHWTGAVNPFSKGSYHAFLARLEFHTVVRRAHKGQNSPYILTSKGRAICNGISEKYNPALSSPAGIRYLSS